MTISGKPHPTSCGIATPRFPDYAAHTMMTQTAWASPKFTIDCVLANVNRQLEADGCVLERLEGAHQCGHKLTAPDHLTVGEFVKVQLWLEGEEAFIDIKLAEIKRVHKHWIAVDVILVNPNDRMRLERFIDVPAAMHLDDPALIDHLLIRA
jgi:hypothetical protein